MSGDAGALPMCEVKTLMTPDHTAFQCAALGMVALELVGLPGKAFIFTLLKLHFSGGRRP